MWVVVGPGDTALVPSPSYPIHLYAPLFAGADVRMVRLEGLGNDEADAGEAFFANLVEAWESAWPKPRVAILSFPHNPTTACIDLATMTRLVEFAREHGVLLVHDFAYSDTAFDGFRPPSILEVPGASEVAVELYTLTKSFSMAGWRVAFLVGNAGDRARAHQAQELPRLRHLPADPDRRHRRHERGAGLPQVRERDLPGAPRRPL